MTVSSSLGYTDSRAAAPRVFVPPRTEPTAGARSLSDVAHVEDIAIDVPRRLLLRWNAAMVLFHSILAAVTLGAGRTDLKVQTYKTVLTFQRRNGTGFDLIPRHEPDGFLYLTILTATFFVLSALFHLLNATLLRRLYIGELQRCRTPTRWIEYTLSAPIMMLLIAYSLGLRERMLLLAVAALIATTMPFGYWIETRSRPVSLKAWATPLSHRLLPWWLGHIPQVAAWTIVIVQFYGGIDSDSPVPWFVYVILWVEFVLFFSFGVASLLSQWSTPDRFYRGELLFQVLSLVSKGLLGILLLSNVLMLSRFDDVFA